MSNLKVDQEAGPTNDTAESESGLVRSGEPTPVPSRRRFFAATASVAAATLVGSREAEAQGAQGSGTDTRRDMVRRILQKTTRPETGPAKSVQISAAAYDSALSKLVRRITNGVTADEMTLARKLGFQGYLNYQLNASKIDDTAVQTYVGTTWPYALMDSSQLYLLDQGQVSTQFQQAVMYRAAFSKRQLYERMAEFFSDHFNIEYATVEYMKVPDERDVPRKFALGKFPDMVRASAHSPAMLEYLDNTRNRINNINENYARELMELHTVGVDGGYTQADVRELSRCLTGWTIASRGVAFSFVPSSHDWGQKVVMGQVIPAQPTNSGQLGMRDGDMMIDYLVAHPNTARYLSKKMIRWLLRYDPTPEQLATVSAVYSSTQGDIPSMIRAILTPENLLAAPAKYRRPYTFILACLRGTSPNVLRLQNVTGTQLRSVGQTLFAWGPPDGYPDTAEYWSGGALPRWNFASYLTTNTADVVVDINRFMTTPTPTGVVESINAALFGGEMPDLLKSQLVAYAQGGTLNTTRAREVLALAMSSSTFQWM
jgi:uncharacterized protein (DUF1800 family)